MRTITLLWIAVVGSVILSGCSSILPDRGPTSTRSHALTTEEWVDLSPTPGQSATSAIVSDAIPAPTVESLTGDTNTTLTEIDPFDLISQETLFAFLESLTAIQPYSGWRNSASLGEAEALDLVAQELDQLTNLGGLGMTQERQTFRVFLGTELWETRLQVTLADQEFEVPADGLRGPRDEIAQALRFDSDGQLNDADRNPRSVEGLVLLVRTPEQIRGLEASDIQGRIIFVDYEAIDRVVLGDISRAVEVAWELFDKGPSGLVLITAYSDQAGESHGTFVADNSALNWVETENAPVVLYARLEDFAQFGIHGWDDLERVQAARLTLDADVFSPAPSGNLVARIPGIDSSQAIILGAHIDSPNSPGAMDDGSGSAILLEIARVLDASNTQPPIDLYLAWFGSEELGLYGSSHFAHTHSELLDRAQGMLQIDMLSYPLGDIQAELTFVTWSYARQGDKRLPWLEHLSARAGARGIETDLDDVFYVYSDNSSFGGFGVPHGDLIYVNEEDMNATGSVHYAARVHDPYDTVELARKVGDVFVEMARVALATALETVPDEQGLRVTPKSDRRVLFVASHTEPIHLSPAALTDLGMTLSMEGYDIDIVPYGQTTTPADLQADLVIVLPVMDYPTIEGDETLYDEAWSEEEIASLEAYVQQGGLLVLTNSAHRLKYANSVLDPNEDWSDVNALAERFGVIYYDGGFASTQARTQGHHPLIDGVQFIEMVEGNALPFESAQAEVLAEVDGQPAIAISAFGNGQVLVLSDVGILGASWGPPANIDFWRNLAQYAQ